MSVEVEGISMSASVAPSFGGGIDMGSVMGGPSFSIVNEGPAPMDLRGFGELSVSPLDALNATVPLEPFSYNPMSHFMDQGPVRGGLKPELNVADVLSEAEAIIAQTRSNPLSEYGALEEAKSIMGITAPDQGNALALFDSKSIDRVISQPGLNSIPVADVSVFKDDETQALVWETPSTIFRAIPEQIKIGIAQPLVEEEEETQIEIEQVREKIRGLSPKTNQAPRAYFSVRVEPSIQPQQAVQLEKIVHKKIEEEKEEEKASAGEKNRIELSQRRMVKDLKALARRLSDARIAITRAFDQVKLDKRTDKKVVGGEEVEKYIPQEYDGVRSRALKEDVDDSVPDGTYVLGRAAIREIKETDSPDEMQSRVDQAWNENYAVERSKGEQGEAASQKQVKDSYMFVNGKPPLRQTFVRMVRERETQVAQTRSGDNVKTLEVPAEIVDSSKEPAGEQEIEDNPQLAELFKIAA